MKIARIAVALATLFAFTAGGGLAVARGGPPDKVRLYHDLEDTGEVDIVRIYDAGVPRFVAVPVYEGTEIEVSERAKDAHLGTRPSGRIRL